MIAETFAPPAQVPSAGGFADTSGARLWFWDTGGDGDVVVLSHPASQSSAIWMYQQPVLARAGYRVVAYSRRGFDRSEAGRSADRGTEVGDFAAIMDALGIARAHVIGAAAGGGVAMRFATAHPERVRSLVLAGSIVAPEEADWREMYARLGIAAVKPHVSTAFIELGPSYRAANPEGTRRFAELSEAAHRNKPGGQPSGVALTWAMMQRCRAPVFLLTGEADLYAPPPLQRLMAQHLPVHELATLPEVGHAPYWEAPDAFNALILRFLDKHRGR
jgi:pimeloyl-ACP methyl ester carboxylesterase